MPVFYEYNCAPCIESNCRLSDEPGDKPGTLCLYRQVDERDAPVVCPECDGFMSRSLGPDSFVLNWCSPQFSKKKIFMGPNDDIYPPTLERRKKAAMGPPISVSMYTGDNKANKAPQTDSVIERAPTKQEAPSAGVSVRK